VLEKFCNWGHPNVQYLRKPTQDDGDRLLQVAEARDFPRMMESIDCMHWSGRTVPWVRKESLQKEFTRFPL